MSLRQDDDDNISTEGDISLGSSGSNSTPLKIQNVSARGDGMTVDSSQSKNGKFEISIPDAGVPESDPDFYEDMAALEEEPTDNEVLAPTENAKTTPANRSLRPNRSSRPAAVATNVAATTEPQDRPDIGLNTDEIPGDDELGTKTDSSPNAPTPSLVPSSNAPAIAPAGLMTPPEVNDDFGVRQKKSSENTDNKKNDEENTPAKIDDTNQKDAALDMVKTNLRARNLNPESIATNLGKLAGEALRKGMDENNFSTFFIAILIALLKDFIDSFDLLIVSAAITFFIKLFLSVALFFASPMGHLWKKFKNIFWRIIFLWAISFIPIIDIIPVNTVSMILLKRELDKEREKLKQKYMPYIDGTMSKQEKKKLKHMSLDELREKVETEQ